MTQHNISPMKLLFGLTFAAGLAITPAMSFAVSFSCDARSYGAKGDGATKDTAALQAAIDACAAKGGGTVRLAAGTYLSAPIVLKSNITLQLDRGATLLGSVDHKDYPLKSEVGKPGRQPLVSATNASNVSIRGEGVIDGAGAAWWLKKGDVNDEGPRP